jgi:hypothetical protein
MDRGISGGELSIVLFSRDIWKYQINKSNMATSVEIWLTLSGAYSQITLLQYIPHNTCLLVGYVECYHAINYYQFSYKITSFISHKFKRHFSATAEK